MKSLIDVVTELSGGLYICAAGLDILKFEQTSLVL